MSLSQSSPYLGTSRTESCPHAPSTSCSNCRMGSLCLPIALDRDEVAKLEDIVQRGRPVDRGHHCYRQDEHFSAVYAVRLGCIKTFYTTADGREQVTGFHLPGEIFGMDGIAQARHVNSAVALETSAVCEIPFDRLQELSTRISSLQRHFFQLMSAEIAADQQLITLLSKSSAEERMAAFFVSISSRFALRHQSPLRFRLPMSRGDISNYLGLTVETVSRILSRLQKSEIIAIDNKEIQICDLSKLKEAAGLAG